MPRRRNKYGNRRVEYDGYTFDSIAEKNRYIELRLMADANLITHLAVHPKYVIHDGFTNAAGKRRSQITYSPDFEYRLDEQWVYEDVKGVETAVFRLKRKLFERRYSAAITIIKA